MRFLVLHATSINPPPGTGRECFVSCWIDDSAERARERAANLIGAQGWSVAEIVEEYDVNREDYINNPAGLVYYEQALIDREVVVLFVVKEDKHGSPRGSNEGGSAARRKRR